MKYTKKTMADQNEDTLGAKSQIIMKVDAPPEDKNIITPQEDIENNVNDTKMESTQSSTPVKPKLATSSAFNSSNSFALRSSILGPSKLSSGFVLRPSALGAKVENKTENKSHTFALNPNRLNPFVKSNTGEDLENCVPKSDSTNGASEITCSSSNCTAVETPKFVPLAVAESSKQSTSTNSVTSTPNFVFGQNLHERIVAENEAATEVNNGQAGPSTSHTNANGTSELLFTSAVKSTSGAMEAPREVKTLSESAREYEESRANKRKYEEVAVVTGEEGEKNVMQINCKLFAFDKATGNWQERGRGTLRLNDQEIIEGDQTQMCARLVIRTAGSLRVVLNTKIWAEMTIELAGPKSLRLTAMDSSGQIKVFLIMANPEEIKQLNRLLEVRVSNEVERQKQQRVEPVSKKAAVHSSD